MTTDRSLRGLALCFLLVASLLPRPLAAASAGSRTTILAAIEHEVVELVKRVEPSIVCIIAERQLIIPVDGRVITTWDRDVGSGIVISPAGDILTTASVVDGATTFRITFFDGQQRSARLVGIDPLSAVAVIRVDSAATVPAALGNSDSVRVGSWAILMGNSFGLPRAPSFGLLSGVDPEDGLLQMSAMSSPGSTGGAAISSDGRVIGLIVGKLTIQSELAGRVGRVRGPEGPGSGPILAVPINRAIAVARQLIEFGEVRRGWLGVDIASMEGGEDGVPIQSVYAGSPAEAAGLRPGDLLVSVNGLPATNPIALADRVANIAAGTDVELRYIRQNQMKSARVRLGRRPTHIDQRLVDEHALTPPPGNTPADLDLVLTTKSLNQWLLELEAEIQRLKHLEGELRNEQMQRVKAQPRR